MRKIIFKIGDEVRLNDIDAKTIPIFAKKKGKIVGMVVQDFNDRRWRLALGGSYSSTGFHDTIQGCLESCLKYDYEFFVN